VQYANVISLSTVTADSQDETFVDNKLKISVNAEDGEFQQYIGQITTT